MDRHSDSPRPAPRRDAARGNRRVAVVLAVVVCAMVGFAFAMVPLYRLFCQVTGTGGTTRTATVVPDRTLDRVVKIRFEGFVNPGLPWRFEPEQREMTLKVGEQGLAFFKATNLSDRPTAGVATFNVTPGKIGQFFNKVHCFCFDAQTLQPRQSVDMGVSFFIDPSIADDPNVAEVKTITLAYTFFPDPDALGKGKAGGAGEQDTSAIQKVAPAERQTAALPK
ncbi:cytochrome c oxidase assembly protein subunit 11 [Tistlia consotensis]|uniref:Cytochrome c oxidase assembly protein CtaG n=1 Tax=Tistlia consotensis USBA 355 TaxID=560819 RepID=A0A1Y6B6I1_9PROT|nr:cytochrome c oxidase assembly protein [Tistlia consotensis]SME94687.1 cytochrome c oxidase assembly protein subunit 11 [Tistlia consotensis USBA 355]SNR29485.1 cytochrome c oxidase assembly protein subunit 11 [Tistlia consotensis]